MSKIKTDRIDKPNRVYFISHYSMPNGNVGFRVSFQPKNPRNGAPWQAIHNITHLAADRYVLGRANSETGEQLGVGPAPEFDSWKHSWHWCQVFISSLTAALWLVERHYYKLSPKLPIIFKRAVDSNPERV